tara:strand:+ start:896 stop:1225 length:330 start_codon:yes stop_codon:yes gene_type:complete
MDDEILVWIGITASLIGLLEFARRVILDTQIQKHQVAKIIILLEDIEKIQDKLEDVLLHPDDSGFGVSWLRVELEELKQVCATIDHRQNEHVKRGIERIEKTLEKITYD